VSWTHWFAGNNTKAEAVARECIAAAPEVYMPYHVAGVALLRSGKPHEAIVLMEQARKLAPVWVVLDSLATAYAEVGRVDEVRAMLQELNAVSASGRYVPDISRAIIHAALGDVEQANLWMSKAIEAREGRVVFLAVGLPDKFLRQNPHYPEWLAKIGLNP